jgi:CubicO group peptidase (beta-lactamase class C family)
MQLDAIDDLAASGGFSGVVAVDSGGERVFERAYGLAHRAYGVPNTVDTRFGLASGSKAFTALAVMSLVEAGTLAMDTTARSLLGADLPLVAADVTVEHLLAHRSGIGDYLDEDDESIKITDYVLPMPVHTLATTEPFVPALDGYPTKFAAGTDFCYCNGGYMLLALLAERASGVPFHDLVDQVLAPAGLADTGYPRSDELPERTATGYLPIDGVSRTNVFHLPVRGNGDGGAYSTAADISAFWAALFDGRILPAARVAQMVAPRSDVPAEKLRYGLGFWLHPTTDQVIITGYDAGVSFLSAHDPTTTRTYTVMSNTSDGAWPMARLVRGLVDVPAPV